MKIKFLLVAFLFLLFSCKNEEKGNLETTNDTIVQTIDSAKVEIQKPKSETKILLATTYRVDVEDDDTKQLTKDWFELYEQNGNYFLDKADYSITNGKDECAGTDTKTIETKRKSILLIDNSTLTKGKIDFIKNYKNTIWPNEESTFVFNGKNYRLKAEGKILSTEERTEDDNTTSVWHNVLNYKLYLKSEDSKEEVIISVPNFEDTFVTLLFVGDIDKDGKPDFIFDAPTNYEEKRVILFLSSDASNGKTVPKGAEISIMFDC
jgi:hypothetical protein